MQMLAAFATPQHERRPTMKNLDLIKQQRDDFKEKLGTAIAQNDPAQLAEAFDGFANAMQELVVREAQGLSQATDATILAQRGVRQLTADERQYYEQVLTAMRDKNPRQALSSLDVAFPKTTVDAIFDDLAQNHPLLEAISFENTSLVTEWLLNEHEVQLAKWGALTDEITKEIGSGFAKLAMNLVKLTAFLPVGKAMLDLGPAWLDRYVRVVLVEALAVGLEEGIINGTGKDMPIGMNRQVGVGVTVTDGVYPLKPMVSLTDMRPETYGAFIAEHLAKTPNGNPRVVSEVLMVVNPADYLRRILPASTMLTPNGVFVRDVFPFPTRVVQSVRLPQGEAVMGIASRYFAGAGMAKDGRIEYSDEYRFLEDERVYLIKLYANGRPMDNQSFVRVNISGLKPLAYRVLTEEATESMTAPNTLLSGLTVGSAALSPAFDPDKAYYTASTTNATNAINATAADEGAHVLIRVNGTEIANGSAATWNVGENVVEITVTSGMAQRTIIVVVTKA